MPGYQGMAIIGWYEPSSGPGGLRLRVPFYAQRKVPASILNTVPPHQVVNYRNNIIQVLINTFESYMWINIYKDQEVRWPKLKDFWANWGKLDPNPAQSCYIGGGH